MVPWPLIYAGFDEAIAREEPETPPVPLEPDPLGRIDLMGTLHAIPGQFRLHDGAAPLTVEYGAGRATTCCNGSPCGSPIQEGSTRGWLLGGSIAA